ncbi:MAG: sigma 54-interacting transcriptional regulator [Desulfacinum sp.]|jgi:PAS domain S-box-containing protein|nr:sigma 54-interacting transcriptional regulator [Desulfacinum sp.]
MDNSLYRAVVETMHDGLLVVDTGGRILAVNPAFEAMTGYSSSELVGRSCQVLNCTGCEITSHLENGHWCTLFRRKTIRRRRCEIKAKDGRTLHVVKDATVLHDAHGRVAGAVETLNDISDVVAKEEEIRGLRVRLARGGYAHGMVGLSEPIRRLGELIDQVASSEAPVLIYGESGVGKELVARAIHEAGLRSKGPFIKVNCASLNESLLESELFGHVKGAFTGAIQSRIGRFEAASGGSIFLDEIGDISPVIQVKLLRVLEAREIERVGDHRTIPVDARIITATNKSLEELVRQGLFREDLYYRINVVPIVVPPLRERPEDIPLLAQAFIERIAARSGKSIQGLTREALDCLVRYAWPGNVRELLNAMEYAFVLCRGDLIGPEHLPARIVGGLAQACEWSPGPSLRAAGLKASREDGERRAVIRALEEARGNRTRAAELLGISRVTLWKRMKKYGID